MAFDVSALATYTKENQDLLVASSVLGSKTASLIKDQGNVMVGVKSSEKINIMDTDAFFQDGSSCGFNASGTTTFTQRTVTVGKIKVNEALCPKDLERTYLQKALPAGSTYDSVVFAEQYSTRKTEKIASQLEIGLWQGDTTSADGNKNKFDGLIKLVTAASSAVVDANTSTYFGSTATAITSANVIAVFDAVYKAIPAEVVAKDDVRIFCGMDVFRTYTIALKNANMFNYAFDGKSDSEFMLPGTTIKVVAVQGLNGTNKIYASRLSNLFIGTDLLNEEERFEIFYAKEADQVRFVSEFKMGVNFAFPGEIVKFVV
ncbi:hypothetical protein UFOVP617_48 [uncultured Caudovirales phage]|uniref:Major capsid protein n=1 Tax=uncultured Caudovirales phage TaxID=2100421 RepID=A0A6J5NC49_9CAUD|nr:hypothetical protein UFOVP617_48 [uncultured Caudovirales phage]